MRIEEEIKQSTFRSEYQKLLLNIIFTSNWLQSHILQMLKSYQLSPQQFNVLRILRGQHPKPATISLIQQRMLDKQSNASRLVEKLRLKGLVERKPRAEDRRVMEVTITDKGLALLRETDKLEEKFDQLLKNLSVDEARMMNEFLDKIRGLTNKGELL
jgi:DNA-binding MarR family transcriptional regulator